MAAPRVTEARQRHADHPPKSIFTHGRNLASNVADLQRAVTLKASLSHGVSLSCS